MAGLTDPFEFKRHLRSKPVSGFDSVPFLDALLIALFIALNSSAFVLSPGTTIDLPASRVVDTLETRPSAVLTVGRNELYFFQGKKLARLTLQEHLKAFVDASRSDDPPVLLLKADASISSSSLFSLMDTARNAGFAEIHLASELSTGSGERVPETSADVQTPPDS